MYYIMQYILLTVHVCLYKLYTRSTYTYVPIVCSLCIHTLPIELVCIYVHVNTLLMLHGCPVVVIKALPFPTRFRVKPTLPCGITSAITAGELFLVGCSSFAVCVMGQLLPRKTRRSSFFEISSKAYHCPILVQEDS